MKKLYGLLALVMILTSAGHSQESAIHAGISYKGVFAGYNYSHPKGVCIPVSIGISSNFTEQKYNDFSFEIWPSYSFRNGRKVELPVGLLTGFKWISNHGNRYPVVYLGCFCGVKYHYGKSNLCLNLGLKYGQHRYIQCTQTAIGQALAYQTYKEQPFVAMLTYAIKING